MTKKESNIKPEGLIRPTPPLHETPEPLMLKAITVLKTMDNAYEYLKQHTIPKPPKGRILREGQNPTPPKDYEFLRNP